MYQQYAHCVILYTSSFIFHLVNLKKKKKKKNRHVSIIYIITLNYDYLRTPFRFAKTKKKVYIIDVLFPRDNTHLPSARINYFTHGRKKRTTKSSGETVFLSRRTFSPCIIHTHTYARTSLLKLTHSRGLYTLSIIIKKHTNAEPKLISNYYTRA